jgi:hypothetical protein
MNVMSGSMNTGCIKEHADGHGHGVIKIPVFFVSVVDLV